jgi:hypothetical protein
MTYVITQEATLRALEMGQSINLCRVAPIGACYARRDSRGIVTLTWRYMFNGANQRQTLGVWDDKADPRKLEKTDTGWTIKGALRVMEGWAMEHQTAIPAGGFKAISEALAAEEEAQAAAVQHCTLGQLMADYSAFLAARGQPQSDVNSRSITKCHIKEPFPDLYNKPATNVNKHDIVLLLNHMNRKSWVQNSVTARAYLHAAFELARTAEGNSDTPRSFLAYKIYSNPVTPVAPPQRPKNAPPRVIRALDTEGMRLYWDIINEGNTFYHHVLRLHLLTGGQRPAQLVRLKTAAIQKDRITILDIKGSTGIAREHRVPLTELARKSLAACCPTGTYALSVRGGFKPLSRRMMSDISQKIVGDRIPGFEIKLVRSGVETILSKWRVSKEARGRLQSHGIKGVQDVHYNADDFFEQKVEAVETLEAVLTRVLLNPPVSDLVQYLRTLKAQQAQPQQNAA